MSGVLDMVVVIQNQPQAGGFLDDVDNLVGQPRYDFARGNSGRELKLLQQTLAKTRDHRFDRHDDSGPEAYQVIVVGVERGPGYGNVAAFLLPGVEQCAFAKAARCTNKSDWGLQFLRQAGPGDQCGGQDRRSDFGDGGEGGVDRRFDGNDGGLRLDEQREWVEVGFASQGSGRFFQLRQV
jgi:hypothetical protein